jgi:hypothetical protein
MFELSADQIKFRARGQEFDTMLWSVRYTVQIANSLIGQAEHRHGRELITAAFCAHLKFGNIFRRLGTHR